MLATLFVSALSVSCAIFLILEMYKPFQGLIRISGAPLDRGARPSREIGNGRWTYSGVNSKCRALGRAAARCCRTRSASRSSSASSALDTWAE